MSEFFSNSGKHFDIESRKSGIINEVEKGAVFFLVKESKMVVGYIEYIETEIEDDIITFRCEGIELLTKLEKYIKNKF